MENEVGEHLEIKNWSCRVQPCIENVTMISSDAIQYVKYSPYLEIHDFRLHFRNVLYTSHMQTHFPYANTLPVVFVERSKLPSLQRSISRVKNLANSRFKQLKRGTNLIPSTFEKYKMMPKNRATKGLLIFFVRLITFLSSNIENNFFYKKWALFVAA